MPTPKLRAAEVREGDAAPVRSLVLTRTDLVKYAGASGDFNPMHHDDTKAAAAGLPSVFGHGMLTAGLLATAVTDYAGIGSLRAYKVRFTRQTWPGETLSTSVTVSRTYEEGGEHRADLQCAVSNQDGEAKVTGDATVALAPPA